MTTKISKLQLRSIREGKDPRLIPGPKASPSRPCLRIIASWESWIIHGHSSIRSSPSEARNRARSKCMDQGHFSENGYLLRFSQGKAKVNNWKRSLKTIDSKRFQTQALAFHQVNRSRIFLWPTQGTSGLQSEILCPCIWNGWKHMKTVRYPSVTNEGGSLVFTPERTLRNLSDCRSAWESPLTSRGWGLKCDVYALLLASNEVKGQKYTKIPDPSPHTMRYIMIRSRKTGLSLLVNLIQFAWRWNYCRQPVELHRVETWSWRNIG